MISPAFLTVLRKQSALFALFANAIPCHSVPRIGRLHRIRRHNDQAILVDRINQSFRPVGRSPQPALFGE